MQFVIQRFSKIFVKKILGLNKMMGTEASCLLLLLLTVLSPVTALPTSGAGHPGRTTTIDYDLADLDEFAADPGAIDTVNYGDPDATGPGTDPGNDPNDDVNLGTSGYAEGEGENNLGAPGLGSYGGLGIGMGFDTNVGLSSEYPYIDTREPLSDEDADPTDSPYNAQRGSTALSTRVSTTDTPDDSDWMITTSAGYRAGLSTGEFGHEQQATSQPENDHGDPRHRDDSGRIKTEERYQISSQQRNARLDKYKLSQGGRSGNMDTVISTDTDIDNDADLDRSASPGTTGSQDTSNAMESMDRHTSQETSAGIDGRPMKTANTETGEKSNTVDTTSHEKDNSQRASNPFTITDDNEKNSKTVDSSVIFPNNSNDKSNGSKSELVSYDPSSNPAEINEPKSNRNNHNETDMSVMQPTGQISDPMSQRSVAGSRSFITEQRDQSRVTDMSTYSADIEQSKSQREETTDLTSCFADDLTKDGICYLATSLHAICAFQYPSECNASVLTEVVSNQHKQPGRTSSGSATADQSKTDGSSGTSASLTAETLESISASFQGSASLFDIVKMIRAICPGLCKLASSALHEAQSPYSPSQKSGHTGDLSNGTDQAVTDLDSIDQDDASLNDSDDVDVPATRDHHSTTTWNKASGSDAAATADDASQDTSEDSQDSDVRLSMGRNGSGFGDYRIGTGGGNDDMINSFESATYDASGSKQTTITENRADEAMEHSHASNGSD